MHVLFFIFLPDKCIAYESTYHVDRGKNDGTIVVCNDEINHAFIYMQCEKKRESDKSRIYFISMIYLVVAVVLPRNETFIIKINKGLYVQ